MTGEIKTIAGKVEALFMCSRCRLYNYNSWGVGMLPDPVVWLTDVRARWPMPLTAHSGRAHRRNLSSCLPPSLSHIIYHLWCSGQHENQLWTSWGLKGSLWPEASVFGLYSHIQGYKNVPKVSSHPCEWCFSCCCISPCTMMRLQKLTRQDRKFPQLTENWLLKRFFFFFSPSCNIVLMTQWRSPFSTLRPKRTL